MSDLAVFMSKLKIIVVIKFNNILYLKVTHIFLFPSSEKTTHMSWFASSMTKPIYDGDRCGVVSL